MSPAAWSMGAGTYRVPMAMYGAHRATLAALLVGALERRGAPPTGVILLQGGAQAERYDTDNEPLFRQESYFHHLFGVREAGCYAAIALPSGAATLFVPRMSAEYEVFCGAFPSPAQFAAEYAVDAAAHVDELVPWLEATLAAHGAGARIHILDGVNSDSGAPYPPPTLPAGGERLAGALERSDLYALAADARSRKSAHEVGLMRYTYALASAAHVAVMRLVRPGLYEYALEAAFLHHAYAHGGARSAAYTAICASGPNGAVLHYGHAGLPNARRIEGDEMLLLDMGCEYACYASDITNSFPASGRFTDKQVSIYAAVLAAQVKVVSHMRAGARWPDLHELAEATLLEGLQRAGLVDAEASPAELVSAGIGAVFMPHGLGHLIGIDTHDVGGYLSAHPPRAARAGICRLRTARVLEAGMVITVEPGCYFIDALLDAALADPARARYLRAGALAAYRGFGGVRIEDGVLVTHDGAQSLAACPRTVAEIEDVMAGGTWPPARDRLPELRRAWARLSSDGASMERFEVPAAD